MTPQALQRRWNQRRHRLQKQVRDQQRAGHDAGVLLERQSVYNVVLWYLESERIWDTTMLRTLRNDTERRIRETREALDLYRQLEPQEGSPWLATYHQRQVLRQRERLAELRKVCTELQHALGEKQR